MAVGQLWRAAVLAIAASTVFAASARADVHVSAGQVVKEIHIVGSDVRVDGTVTGHVVVIGGDLTVGRSGRLYSADLLAGNVRIEPGARVSGDVLQIGGALPRPRGPRAWIFIAVALAVRSLIAWLILQAALLLAPRGLGARLGEAASDRPLRTVLVGALVSVGLLSASILAAVSVIGLPLAAALIGLLVSGGLAGLAILMRASDGSARARTVALGALLLPVLGEAIICLATVVGLGALLRIVGAPTRALSSTAP